MKETRSILCSRTKESTVVNGNASDGECVLVLLLEFGRDDAVIGGVRVIMPELEHAFGVADGEIVRLDAIEEALAAKDVAEQCERISRRVSKSGRSCGAEGKTWAKT